MTQETNSDLIHVADQYLKMLKARVTRTSLQDSLKENPYYPSLYSLSAVCDRLGIPNQSFKITAQDFNQLEAPFIAFYNNHSDNDFVLVTGVTNSSIDFTDGKKKFSLTKEQFLSNYREVIFVAEPNETSGEKNYEEKLKKEKNNKTKTQALIGASVITAILIFSLSIYSQLQTPGQGLSFAFLAVAKLIGLATTVLLLIYEIDKSNEVVKSICSAGTPNGCDAVLNSKASKIFGMSWGEIGFYYFSSTTLFLLFPGIGFSAKVAWLGAASSLAAPYTLFSLYYQWIKLKQWCSLCLTVQASLLLEFTWSVLNFWSGDIHWNDFDNIQTIAVGAICISMPAILWNILKPIISKAKEAPESQAAYKRLLYNPETFNALLQQQPETADGWQELGIILGNPNAANTIIKVCNPYCGPCAKTHPVLEEIISHNANYNLRIIFTATNQESDSRTPVIKHLLAVAEKGNSAETTKAVNDWYSAKQKNYESFASKYPMNGELKRQNEKIDAMDKWCHEAKIAYTPTIFINGKRLPETYSAQELKFILQ